MTASLFIALTLLFSGPQPEYRQAYEAGINAYQAGDQATFISETEKAYKLFPGHLGVLNNLALGYVMTDRADDAVALLAQAAELGVYWDLAGHRLFSKLQEHPRFAEIQEKMAANNRALGKAEIAFEVEPIGFFPEAVVYDAVRERFLVSSVHQRRIVQIDKDGKLSPFVTEGAHGLWSVLGLAVDAERGRLYAATAAIDQTKDLEPEDKGGTGLFVFDLETGAFIKKVILAEAGQSLNWGDIVIAPDGALFLADGRQARIHRVDPETLNQEIYFQDGWLRSPQGMTFSADGSRLYIADYSNGLLIADLKSREVSPLEGAQKYISQGMDGLTLWNGKLIGIQNGLRPHRISLWHLNEKGDGLDRFSVLEQNHEGFDEPTLGTLVDGRFYFIANSQWGAYDDKFQPKTDLLQPIRIMKITLP